VYLGWCPWHFTPRTEKLRTNAIRLSKAAPAVGQLRPPGYTSGAPRFSTLAQVLVMTSSPVLRLARGELPPRPWPLYRRHPHHRDHSVLRAERLRGAAPLPTNSIRLWTLAAPPRTATEQWQQQDAPKDGTDLRS
jgi:hypothetical protein